LSDPYLGDEAHNFKINTTISAEFNSAGVEFYNRLQPATNIRAAKLRSNIPAHAKS
jgi:hypothetical protein